MTLDRPTLDPPTLVRATLLGLTTGSRSFSGLAAQVAVTPRLSWRQPERALGHPWIKGLVALLAAGELVGDKLPTAPSRLVPPVLVPRLVLAAVSALLVARAEDQAGRALHEPAADGQGPAEAGLPPEPEAPAVPGSALLAVPLAVGASLASAFLGSAWRSRATTLLGRDWPGAVLEDAVALGLARVATRR